MTMSIDDDIHAAAERFVARYGDDAPGEARRRSRELDDAGHKREAAEWERIALLAAGLLAHTAEDGSTLH